MLLSALAILTELICRCFRFVLCGGVCQYPEALRADIMHLTFGREPLLNLVIFSCCTHIERLRGEWNISLTSRGQDTHEDAPQKLQQKLRYLLPNICTICGRIPTSLA